MRTGGPIEVVPAHLGVEAAGKLQCSHEASQTSDEESTPKHAGFGNKERALRQGYGPDEIERASRTQ